MHGAIFDDYVTELVDLLDSKKHNSNGAWLRLYDAPNIVRDSYNKRYRKARGIYFTGAVLAKRLAHRVLPQISEGWVVLDPAMGAGDLLISSAMQMPKQKSAAATVRAWSKLLIGYDSDERFVTAAKLRLALLARLLHRGERVSSDAALNAFPNLKQADFMDVDLRSIKKGLCVVTNPPFTTMRRPLPPGDARAARSLAAVFLEKLCSEIPSMSHITGLFPEVIRCGSSYESLRKNLYRQMIVLHEESIGQFDRNVDIDVFVGHYKRHCETRFAQRAAETKKGADAVALGEICDVTVGSVVPHRTRMAGPWRRYIAANLVPPWSRAFKPVKSVRYGGPSYTPPFVVVRRTSSPRQKFRAVASLIVGSTPVAVENHLFVLRPKDGKLQTCEEIIRRLRSEDINCVLNSKMRCRHLTLESLLSLPM
jgi:hypothetical protein